MEEGGRAPGSGACSPQLWQMRLGLVIHRALVAWFGLCLFQHWGFFFFPSFSIDILVTTPNRLIYLLKQDPPAIDLTRYRESLSSRAWSRFATSGAAEKRMHVS